MKRIYTLVYIPKSVKKNNSNSSLVLFVTFKILMKFQDSFGKFDKVHEKYYTAIRFKYTGYLVGYECYWNEITFNCAFENFNVFVFPT